MNKIRLTKVTTREITLTGKELVDIFCQHYNIDPKSLEYKALVHIPGGGDWSNMSLSLDDSPINLIITQKETCEEWPLFSEENK